MGISANTSKPKIKLIQRARDIVNTTVNLLKPDMFFGIFLLVEITLVALRQNNWGFDIVFGVFIICYFIERIIKFFKKKNVEI
jgi:hypothetical protein